MKYPWELAEDAVNDLLERYSLEAFRGIGDDIWVSFIEGSKHRTVLLHSPQWSRWLVQNRYAVSPAVEKQIILNIAGIADGTDQRTVAVRVARAGKAVQIDLGSSCYEAVHISGATKGFTIGPPKGVFFHRPPKQRALPMPKFCRREDFLQLFQGLIPDLDSGNWLLVLAFVLKSLHRDNGAYVILIVEGPQGSGKTILSRRLKALIDPTTSESRTTPGGIIEFAVAARNEHLIVLENISGLNDKTSDILCCFSTGAGYSKKKNLHEEVSYWLHNPVIINGINGPSGKPDFLDRCVTLILRPLSDDQRILESKLEEKFESNLPKLLWGVYSLLADCLRVIPQVEAVGLPRMTEYAVMGIAIEKILKLPPGQFLKTYKKNLNDQVSIIFWNDDLCVAIYRKVHESQSKRIEGTAHELVSALFGKAVSVGSASKQGRIFSERLRRVELTLKSKGIIVERPSRSAGKRPIIIRLSTSVEDCGASRSTATTDDWNDL